MRGCGARNRAGAAGSGAEVPVRRVRRELAEAAAALLDRRRAERRAERQERRAAADLGPLQAARRARAVSAARSAHPLERRADAATGASLAQRRAARPRSEGASRTPASSVSRTKSDDPPPPPPPPAPAPLGGRLVSLSVIVTVS